MSKIAICRVCLSNNNRLYAISNTALQEVWERLTNAKFNNNDGKPVHACFICYAHLKRAHQMIQRATKTEEVLTDIINNGLEVSENSITSITKNNLKYNYAISKQFYYEYNEIQLEVNGVSEVKNENKEEKIDIKEEEDFSDSNHKEDLDPGNLGSDTDSEDNVPLKDIRPKRKVEKALCERRERKPRKIILKKIDKSEKLDVVEIVLTKEEQFEELLKRSQTQNYLYSPYKCELCFKGFVDSRAYENHKEKHSESCGAHECDICHMRYKTARHLRTHLYNVHERLYKCNKCSFISHTPNQAKQHEQWHEGYTYECKLCSLKFRKSTSYLTHMRKLHPTGNICNICGESFVGKLGLMLHKTKMHRKEDETVDKTDVPHTDTFCSECNMQFSTLDAWKRHILTSVKHTMASENSTQCKICEMNVTKGNLASHMKEHDKNMRKAKTAPICEVKIPMVPCNQCGAKFINGTKLRAHVKRMHLGIKYNKNLVCESCGRKCPSNAALLYHKRLHTGERPYECNVCNKKFRDSNQLKLHTRTHTGEQPYCCNQCGKRFCQKPALSRHYRVHTGAKPYECQYCSKAFSQSNSLKGHIKTVHLKMPTNYRRKNQKKIEAIENVEKQEMQEISVQ